MDLVSELENAIGAELLRARLLKTALPRLAGRYVIEQVLGRGASGLVVGALDERLARAVALKLTVVMDTADAESLAEARALARLDHPNVVRVLDADLSSWATGRIDIPIRITSMPRVDGVSLRAWLRERPRTPAEIVSVFLAAGAGLAAAHTQRIIHRDFKPDNVFVRDDGVAQVIDFGLAVAHHSSSEPRDVAGTAPYLAPEVHRGQVGPRSDQYAFGISLVEALTGSPTPPMPSPPAGVEARLWAVVLRTTQRSPRRRYRDMDAVIDALRSASKRRWGCGVWSLAALMSGCLFCLGLWPAFWLYGELRCGPFAGSWTFRTHVDASDDATVMPVGTEGLYELSLTHRDYCILDAELDHTGDDGPRGRHRYHQVTRWDTPNGVMLVPTTPWTLLLVPPGDPDRGTLYELWLTDDRHVEGGTFDHRAVGSRDTHYSGHILAGDR